MEMLMFFCLPLKIEQGRDKEFIPIVNLVLIAVNLLIFCFPKTIVGFGFLYSTVTYAFIHATLWHLLGNMWIFSKNTFNAG